MAVALKMRLPTVRSGEQQVLSQQSVGTRFAMTISNYFDNSQEPTEYDAVLGGHSPDISTAAVLGGHHKRLALIFTLFNSRAKPCNGRWLRLQIDNQVALTRKRNSDPIGPITIKVYATTFEFERDGDAVQGYIWWFAGLLKHDGPLFGETATYDPAGCDPNLRAIAQHALNKLALELHNKG